MNSKFDYVECFNTAMESIEYDNPDKFLKAEATVENVIAEYQRLEPQQQEQLNNIFMQQIMPQAQMPQNQISP